MPLSNNRNQDTESNEVRLSVERQPKNELDNCPITEFIEKNKQNKNEKILANHLRVNPSPSTSIANFIDTYFRNRFDPLVKRIGMLENQCNSNVHLIQEVKINMNTVSKNINLNAQESKNSFNIIKNILINDLSKNGT